MAQEFIVALLAVAAVAGAALVIADQALLFRRAASEVSAKLAGHEPNSRIDRLRAWGALALPLYPRPATPEIARMTSVSPESVRRWIDALDLSSDQASRKSGTSPFDSIDEPITVQLRIYGADDRMVEEMRFVVSPTGDRTGGGVGEVKTGEQGVGPT